MRALEWEVLSMRPFPRLSSLLVVILLTLAAMPLLAGVAAAADADGPDERVLVSVNGDLAVAAGELVDVLVVVNGDARIEGQATVVVVVNGTASLEGGTVDTLTVVNGTARLEAGSTVTRDVLELNSAVVIDPGATVGGEVRPLAADMADIGIAIGVLGVIAWVAFAIVTWAAGMALAAFGSRQVRTAEWLISTEPLRVFLVGLGMVFLPPIVAILLMATVVLLPVGLALLLVAWPVLAFLGWLVGATWIGEWILRTMGRPAPERRPYLGVTIGLVVATLLSLIPIVGAVISLFGLGAVTLAGWRMLRGSPGPGAAGAFPAAA